MHTAETNSTLDDCHSRVDLASNKQLYQCTHPKVHTPHQIVDPEICKSCEYSKKAPPKTKRVSNLVTNSRRRLNKRSLQIAIIIPSHNYAKYVAEAIESALQQSYSASEILVLDDNSTDNTEEVVTPYLSRGVRYLHVEYGNVHAVRYRGLIETSSDIVCFLDADDTLPHNYLENGIKEFNSFRVGIVYSNMQTFGSETSERIFPEQYDEKKLVEENFIHAGSLVRREALLISNAFETPLHPRIAGLTGDWFIWRKVLQTGWTARRQTAVYQYRQHSRSSTRNFAHNYTYYEKAVLAEEKITLFIPLSGRTKYWVRMKNFLEKQSWPHDKILLFFLDTSQNSAFSMKIKHWLLKSDYSDFRYIKQKVGDQGLADLPRLESANMVRLAMARIYNRMAREITTNYLWILEDDIIPELDVCERLLRAFDKNTASVSAPYISRFHNGYVVWDKRGKMYSTKRGRIQSVGGNGFGCVILRSHLISGSVFTAQSDPPDFDIAFYDRLKSTNYTAKVHWDIECEHLS